ncbi:axonemal dynein light chain domain-containing protein 1 isoform X2 [Notamacropus eugenii]|uniref:axonemal dynein light chain domain-containing protein 1 isoform X2 n=1 Tax=Notamacropus eugenii TaxID=9315 RepID=UPI003B684FF2
MSKSRKYGLLPPVQPSTSEKKEVMDLKATNQKEIVTSEVAEQSSALVCSQETQLQCDFIPEEIILSLTNTAYACGCPENLLPPKKVKTIKEMKPGMRTTSNVWHHPGRRNKFRYLTDNPISFTGAGRDVSFLYDVKAEKLADSWLPQLVKEITSGEEKPHKGLSIPQMSPRKLTDTLIPEEFHIVSNTGVEGLQYYDDKYTTLLTDSQNRLLLFPSMKPNKRIEVIQLKNVMDMMLEKAGVDADKSVNATQMHRLLEILKTEQNIYNTAFHELIRQISVDCAERGELLSNIRQRYVNLLDQIARQMIDFYKDMVAQRIMDKRIIEELFNFKKVVEELSRELVLVREYDLKLRKKSEKIHEELRVALSNAEKNARIVEQYHDLYTSQRVRMEADIKQLTSERDIWSSATYDLALKVIKKNNLILTRRLYLNEKAWNKYVTHFIVMLASQDAADLSQLQKATQQWRTLFRNLKYDLETREEKIRERVNFVKNTLIKLQKFFEKNTVDGILAPIKDSTMKTICADLKKCNQMLIEDADHYGGDKLVEKVESLKVAHRLQGSWTEYGKEIINRHKSIAGEFPLQQGLIEEINESGSRLCREYEARVNGDENGYNKYFLSLNSALESWIYKMESDHPISSMTQGDWKTFNAKIPDLLGFLDGMLSVIGIIPLTEEQIRNNYVPVVQTKVFHLMQQWILTISNGTDKDNCELHHQVNELHIAMIKWMVNMLILMIPDYTDEHSLPKTEMDANEEQVRLHTGIAMLELEGMSLAKMLSRFSIYIFSCCKSTVAAIAMKKAASFDANADKEVENLAKIKRECIDWVTTCNLLLSEMKGRKVTLLTSEDTKSLYEYELDVDQNSYNVSGWEKTFGEMASQYLEEKFDTEESPKEDLEEAEVSSAPKAILIRYIGKDQNIHSRTLEVEQLVPAEEEVTAFAQFTTNEKERLESLSLIDHLKVKLLNTEIRVQHAEEKYEEINEKLNEALLKNRELEKELHKAQELLRIAYTKGILKEEEDDDEDDDEKAEPSGSKEPKDSGSKSKDHHAQESQRVDQEGSVTGK